MRGWTAALVLGVAALASAAVAAQPPKVFERAGDIWFTDSDGVTRKVSAGGGFKAPAIAPDGHTLAFIHVDGPAPDAAADPPTSLWIGDGREGASHQLIGHHDDADMKAVFFSYGDPVFSLDGGYVYVTAQAWATSGAVHRVSIATHQERFVIDGGVSAVIRTGPWRGYLLVGRHMYHPKGGSYDPTYVVRPDAGQLFMVPGTDKDDGVDHVALWLKGHGWQAW
jgi:hypothetical protein